jgi:hypothetical protein
MMFIVVLVYIGVSILLGILEIGLFVQPFLNLGLGYWVAKHRECDFRWMDALKIVFATGTVLIATVALVLGVLTLSPFIGLINALFSILLIIRRVLKMFPEGGRKKKPTFLEDVKDLIDERQGAHEWSQDN